MHPDAGEEHAPQPLGICYIAAYARSRGYDVDLYDLADRHPLGRDSHLVDELAGYDVIGVTSYTKTFAAALALVEKIRERNATVHVVLGGSHATPCAEELVTQCPAIDFVVRNDGEVPFVALLDELSGPDGVGDLRRVPNLTYLGPAGVVSNPPPGEVPALDGLPFPARDFVVEPSRTYYETRGRARPGLTFFLSSTRGCPKRCTFCSIIVMNPKW